MNPVERSQTNATEALLASWMERLLDDRRAGREIDWEALAAEHPALAAELKSLWPVLVSLDDGSSPGAHLPALFRKEPSGATIGDYRLLRFIGRGGMGTVYLAEQVSLERIVALKVLPLAGCFDERQLKRFKNEARAASTFHHPNIVPVFCVGEDRGVHYFAMKYVPGRDLAKIIAHLRDTRRKAHLKTEEVPTAAPHVDHASYIDDETLTAAATTRDTCAAPEVAGVYLHWAARLAVQAARAIQHAHDEGIVHRDIKPANLILQAPEHLWVTDFGLAMRPTAEALTLTGSVPGTIRYMSLEQAAGRAVDSRTDIYSLGVTLYELLTLRPAFDCPDNDRLLHDVIDGEPPEPRTIDPAIPEPLERIVLKAIRKDPEERYATAADLATDLERFLDDKPVLAQRVTRMARALRWHRRRPRTVLAMLVGSAAMTLLFAVVSLLLTRAYRAESEAHHTASAAQADAQAHLERLRREVYNHQLARAAAAAESKSLDALTLLWDQDRCPPRLRDLTWGLLNRRARLRGEVVAEAAHGFLCVAISPDESLLAAGGKGNDVVVVDTTTDEVVAKLTGHTDWVTGVAFLEEGKQLASSSRDGTVRVWDIAQQETIAMLRPGNGRIASFAVSPDGSQLATGGSDGTISAWNTVDWSRRWPVTYSRDPVLSLSYSPDGARLASGSMGSWVRLMHTTDGRPLASQHVAAYGAGGLRVYDLAFAPDGASILASTSGQYTFDLDARSLFQTGMRNAAYSAWDAISLSGGRFVAAGDDGVVHMVDAATGASETLLVGHRGPARALCFANDAGTIYSAGEDGTLRRWRKDFALHEEARLGATPGVPCLALSPSGTALAVAGENGVIQIWDTHTLQVVTSWKGHDHTINAVSFAPDESLLVSASKDHTAKAWDWRDGRLLATIYTSANWLEAAVFTPDGRSLYLSGRDAAIRRFRVSDWSSDATWSGHTDRVWGLAVSSDGRRLASASRDRTFRVWDTASGATVWTRHCLEPVGAVAFSPDGRTLAAATSRSSYNAAFSGEVELWDSTTRQPRAIIRGHGDEVNGIAFTPDGKTFISTSADRTARLWDAFSGQERAVLRGHQDWVYAVAVAPDSHRLFTVGKDQTLIAWRGDDVQPTTAARAATQTLANEQVAQSSSSVVATLQPSTRSVWEVALSNDGRLMAASDVDRLTTVWNVADWTVAAKLALPEIDVANDLTFSPDSRWLAISSGTHATRLWNLKTNEVIEAPRSVGCDGGVVFSATGRYLASTTYLGRLQVFDITEQEQVPPEELAARLAAENDRFVQPRIAGVNNFTRSLSIWELASARVVSTLNDLPETCGQAIVSRDGSRCFALLQCYDDQILSIDSDTGAITGRYGSHSRPPLRMALSNEASLLASACNEDYSAHVWQLAPKKLIAELGHQAAVSCIDLSPDGQTAVCGFGDGKVRVWRISRDARRPK